MRPTSKTDRRAAVRAPSPTTATSVPADGIAATGLGALLMVASSCAQAATVYDWSFDGGVLLQGAGKLVANDSPTGGPFQITAINGIYFGGTIGQLLPANGFTDNLLYPAAPYVDGAGPSFTVLGQPNATRGGFTNGAVFGGPSNGNFGYTCAPSQGCTYVGGTLRVAPLAAALPFDNSTADAYGRGLSVVQLQGQSVYSTDVPVTTIPQTGAPNPTSLKLTTGDGLQVNAPFAFNELPNATMQFWFKPDSLATAPIQQTMFWTTTSSQPGNFFNIGFLPDGTFTAGYLSPSSVPHNITNDVAHGVLAGQWNFAALVKEGNVYKTYLNGVLLSTVTDINPDLPTSTGWTINGRWPIQPESRNQYQYSGLIDGLLISDEALLPSQFENAVGVPEPSGLALLGAGLFGAGLARRHRRAPRA